MINASFVSLETVIKEVLLRTIAGSGGYSFIITDEYFQLPRITLSKAEGLVFLHLPYYVQSLSLVGWLNNVLGNALGDDLLLVVSKDI